MSRAKHMRKTQILAKMHKLKTQATAEAWTQQQYAVQYNTSPQKGIQEVTVHHMQTVQVNSFNEQNDNKHIQPLWLITQLNAQVHRLDSEVDRGSGVQHYAPINLQSHVLGQETRSSYCNHQ